MVGLAEGAGGAKEGLGGGKRSGSEEGRGKLADERGRSSDGGDQPTRTSDKARAADGTMNQGRHASAMHRPG